MAAGSSSGFTSRSQCGGRFTIGTQLTRRGAAAARNSKPIGSAGRFYKSNPIVPEPSTGRPTKRTRLAVRPGVGQFEAKWAAQPPGQITKRTHLAGRWDRDNRTIDAGQFEPNFAGATGRIQFEANCSPRSDNSNPIPAGPEPMGGSSSPVVLFGCQGSMAGAVFRRRL